MNGLNRRQQLGKAKAQGKVQRWVIVAFGIMLAFAIIATGWALATNPDRVNTPTLTAMSTQPEEGSSLTACKAVLVGQSVPYQPKSGGELFDLVVTALDEEENIWIAGVDEALRVGDHIPYHWSDGNWYDIAIIEGFDERVDTVTICSIDPWIRVPTPDWADQVENIDVTPEPTFTAMPLDGTVAVSDIVIGIGSFASLQQFIEGEGHGILLGDAVWVNPGDLIIREWKVPELGLSGNITVPIKDMGVDDLVIVQMTIGGNKWGVPICYIEAEESGKLLVRTINIDSPSPTIPMNK